MSENINAYCSVCGNGYYACLSCEEKLAAAPWKRHTDTSEHYKVYQIVRGYNTGVYNKDEAAERLGRVDLSDRDGFVDAVKKCVDEILPVEQKVSRPKFKSRYERKIEKPVEAEGVADKAVEAIEDKPVEDEM